MSAYSSRNWNGCGCGNFPAYGLHLYNSRSHVSEGYWPPFIPPLSSFVKGEKDENCEKEVSKAGEECSETV